MRRVGWRPVGVSRVVMKDECLGRRWWREGKEKSVGSVSSD